MNKVSVWSSMRSVNVFHVVAFIHLSACFTVCSTFVMALVTLLSLRPSIFLRHKWKCFEKKPDESLYTSFHQVDYIRHFARAKGNTVKIKGGGEGSYFFFFCGGKLKCSASFLKGGIGI